MKIPAKDRSFQILIAATVLALLVSVLFCWTYPINIGQSDNPTFVRMIALGSSNLMHASGYPAIVYLLTHRFMPLFSSPIYQPNDLNNRWFSTLQGIQLLFHVALFLISIFLCAKVFGKSVAAILALGWGCNVLFVSNVDATAPEWLEGHAMILAVLMHAYARRMTTGWKVLVYCLAAGVFSIAYLIKPNSLLLAISLLAFLLFDKGGWRFKALQLAGSIAIFLLVTEAFAGSYHYASTGTKQLNFDHAWVLTASLPTDYVSASPERLGINSLRWAALSRVTPPEYFRAGGIENISFGPSPDVRQLYQRQLDYIFSLSREELIQFVKSRPLPANFSQWLSSVPLYYYYGLERTDTLGSAVYMESLRSHPFYHLQKLAETFATFLLKGLKTIQTFPTFADPIEYKFLPADFSASLLGTSRIVPPADKDPFVLEYYNPRETVSSVGVRVIEALNAVTSASFVYLALNIVAVLGLFKLKSDLEKITAFSLLAALLAFISASGILLGMRQKELIAITPVYFLLLSLGLLHAREWLRGNK